jgi:uncharacterized membrane protein YphA (DoxX/SURF4 family)
MDTAVWIVQVLVALAFAMAGIGKLTQPREKLAARMAWVEDFSANQVRLIGLVELLGAIGVILPSLTGILPWLTPFAGAGLALVMVGAAVTHLRRGEYGVIAVNLVLLALAVFVAYGRFVAAPIT